MDEERRNGGGDEVPLPRTERPDAPLYLARYLERRAREQRALPNEPPDDGTPLYLRRFRARRETGEGLLSPPPLWSGGDGQPATEAWAENTRTKEIVPPPEAREEAVLEIHVVRHAETQGYSVDGGLTPLGSWQAHRRGHDLSKGIRDGESVVLVCAPTARAEQTAEHVRRGLEDGLVLWGREATVDGPIPMEEFKNFQVWSPEVGLRDPTQAFREYHAVLERYERVALGDRPLWLVEMDRFWRTQQGGGDPIHHWMTVPMLHFEPPAHVVLRFWSGFVRLAGEHPTARIVCATHSGPMRALATWAFGYDPGEPYNTEEVRVRVRPSLKEGTVTFRNRTQEVHVPPAPEWPSWWQDRPGTEVERTAEPTGSIAERR